jgi:FkbM family methyltransferase
MLAFFSSFRNRLKSSSVRRLYWALAKRDVLASSKREEEFYRQLLVGFHPNDIIFDLGANEGAKTDTFLRIGARVVSVEPDTTCQGVLRDRFKGRLTRSDRFILVDKAASDKIGTERMWIDGPGSAVNTFSRKWAKHLMEHKESFKYTHYGMNFSESRLVGTTTISDLVRCHGLPFFIKIDVEGHELSVLHGMQLPVPFLSFEINLQALREEGIECVKLLQKLQPNGSFNYTPDCKSGLALSTWLDSQRFIELLSSCTQESIEVFWRSNCKFVRSKGTS